MNEENIKNAIALLEASPFDSVAMEILFQSASELVGNSKSNIESFDESGFLKAMRIIKRELNKRLKAIGVFDKSQNNTIHLNPRFSDFCMTMVEAMAQHSITSNYHVLLQISLELYDNLQMYNEPGKDESS